MTTAELIPSDNAPIPAVPIEDAHAAARTVARLAHDHADARLILTALGLVENGRIVAPRAHLTGLDTRPVVG